MSCYSFPPLLLHYHPRPSPSSPSSSPAPLCHRRSHLLSRPPPHKIITSSLIRPPLFKSLRSTASPCRQHRRHHIVEPGGGDDNNSGRGGNGNNRGNNNNNSGGGHHSDRKGNGDDNLDRRSSVVIALASLLSTLCYLRFFSSLALAKAPPPNDGDGPAAILAWEVRGGKWSSLSPHPSGDELLIDGRKPAAGLAECLLQLPLSLPNDLDSCWKQCRDAFLRLMLPEGYPRSVTGDYLEYSLWRGVQGIASQISGVLSTQALLFAVGLGKGAIPTAAAVNWVLKDGIGYLSKILLSKFGRHFDVNPKGWRLFADLLENTAYGLEIVTPALPHLFVPIGAVAGSSRSAAYLIQAATKNSFNAGFAAQRNFAEVIAKGEAQGMVSKFVGIALGIALANYTGSSTPLTLSTFGIVSAVHMYCNLKSYQSIQLRTLNPYRASLVFSEYLLSGQVPLVKEVNNEEPLFPGLPHVNLKSSSTEEIQVLTPEAKDSALQIANRLKLGCKLSDVVDKREEACLLFELFKHERYMLAEKQGEFCVILKEDSLPEDMLKSVFHVNYLYWLERNVGWLEPKSICEECRPGGRLHISMEYVRREFDHVKRDGQLSGWVTDGLIARPLPYRIFPGYDGSFRQTSG